MLCYLRRFGDDTSQYEPVNVARQRATNMAKLAKMAKVAKMALRSKCWSAA